MGNYYLIHSAKGTSWSKKNHKYLSKENVLGKVNYVYGKATDKYNSVIADNELILDSYNRDENINKIWQTKEWQDIVKRQDPEYVRKNSDGTVSYLIDDYVAKKKHPVLDVLDDVVNNRKITVNDITKKSLIATGDDYVKRLGTYLYLGVNVLLAGSKARQGAYDEQINNATATVNSTYNTASKYANSAYNKYK